MTETAPVTAIIITKNPDLSHLGMTLRSLAKQQAPPDEVLHIDSTPNGLPLDDPEKCSLCQELVKDSVDSLEEQGSKYDLVFEEQKGIGEARQAGMSKASNDIVWHLDEDAVLRNDDYTINALSALEQDGVAAVGGSIEPIDGSKTWSAVASADNAMNAIPGGWYLMHPVAYCDGEKCTRPEQHRGEDITIREQLREYGELRRVPNNVAGKAMPTTRQAMAQQILVSAVGGAIAGALGGIVRDTAMQAIDNR